MVCSLASVIVQISFPVSEPPAARTLSDDVGLGYLLRTSVIGRFQDLKKAIGGWILGSCKPMHS